jgi:hypothetical protein
LLPEAVVPNLFPSSRDGMGMGVGCGVPAKEGVRAATTWWLLAAIRTLGGEVKVIRVVSFSLASLVLTVFRTLTCVAIEVSTDLEEC